MLMHAAIWPSCENKNNLEADIADAVNAVLFFFPACMMVLGDTSRLVTRTDDNCVNVYKVVMVNVNDQLC